MLYNYFIASLFTGFLSSIVVVFGIVDVDLFDFSPTRGIKLIGATDTYGYETGISVSDAGDVNNDGFLDVIIGAHFADDGAGVSFVVFGHGSDFNFSDVNLGSMVTGPTTGFRLIGAVGDSSGRSVAAAGDVNNDGIDDFMVGAHVNALTYVIYGQDSSSAVADIELSSFPTSAATGFVIIGDEPSTGWCVSVAGDINGDHVNDLIVTARQAVTSKGITYIIFGNYTREGDIQLSSLTASGRGFRIVGAANDDQSGFFASNAGDVNGDGVGDIIIGAPYADSPANVQDAGITYVLFGRNTSAVGALPYADIDLSTFVSDGATGYRLLGFAAYEFSGWNVNGLGDINADGFSDVVICSLDISYVILGRTSVGFTYDDISFAIWESSFSHLGFRLFGAGDAASSAGDVNGDGYDDILCSSIYASYKNTRSTNGVAYVIYGHSTESPFIDVFLETLVASENIGFRIIGAQDNNQLGFSVSSAGDFNSDGYDDVIVSAIFAYNDAGAAYIVFGQPSAPSSQPSTQPSSQPSRQPSVQPSRRPSNQPTGQPTFQPFVLPSSQPSVQPSSQPSQQPSAQPLISPSSQPSRQPSWAPSQQPSTQPTARPTVQPSSAPSQQPTAPPTGQPSHQPSALPSAQPSRQPSSNPSGQPSIQPSASPSVQPTSQPSSIPSTQPVSAPSTQPSTQPTDCPSMQPSQQPSRQPSTYPSGQPMADPTSQPTVRPSAQPSFQPSSQPTLQPSAVPSVVPSDQPSMQPSMQPTSLPTRNPSSQPSVQPTGQPTRQPSAQPSLQPSVQPSKQPTARPTAQPSRQPSTQPSSQPSRQPSRQPTRQPTGQPTHAPSLPQITVTGEWVFLPSTNISIVDVTTSVQSDLWVCGGFLKMTCVLVNANSGVPGAILPFPWNRAISVLTSGHVNGVILSANQERSGVAYSEVASCVYEASIVCGVQELSDTTLVAAVSVPYSGEFVYSGQYNALPTIIIQEPSTNLNVGAMRSYAYTPSAVRSMQLTRITSVPSFAAAFVAGTGTIQANGLTVPVIVTGWVSTSSGLLSAMYLRPLSGSLVTSTDLVNVIAMAGVGPDSLIAGGLQVGGSGVRNAYVARINALYKTASYGVRYINKVNARTQSAVTGMVSEGNVAFLLLAVESFANTKRIAVLRINPATGAITQQMSLSVSNTNTSCTAITATALSLVLTCTLETSGSTSQSAVVLATNRDLSFKRLPTGWNRNSTISFTTLSSQFAATSFVAPRASKAIPSSTYTYSTTGQAPTWRPTIAPTIQLSARPSLRPSMQPSNAPSGQPSSSPTAAPSISPQPTSHPSTGGPTNTFKPSVKPTQRPSTVPTLPPTVRPSTKPTAVPSVAPTLTPSTNPSTHPSMSPSVSPTQHPSVRPTRLRTARPSKPTTAVPTMANSTESEPLTLGADKKQIDTTAALIVGVTAASAALAFGLFAILLCALCSYKLRKNKEKYVQRRATMLPQRAPNKLPSTSHETPLCTATTEAITSGNAPPLSNFGTNKDENASGNSSSIELSSLHSSEMSDFEYDQSNFTSSPSTSVRRLSEMEAQRADRDDDPEDVIHRIYKSDMSSYEDDSSIERELSDILDGWDNSSYDSHQ